MKAQGLAGASSPFVQEIEDIVWGRDMPYIDAVIEYCTRRKIEIESVAPMILADPVILSKIEAEAMDLRFLKRGASLHF